mgnify:CR=1 FL=1
MPPPAALLNSSIRALATATAHLSDLSDATHQAIALSGTTGVLNLATLPTFGTRWLMPRIPDFVQKNPEITLSFATRIGQFDFRAENIDAAIHVGRPDWPDADCKFLMGETTLPHAWQFVTRPRWLFDYLRDGATIVFNLCLYRPRRIGRR